MSVTKFFAIYFSVRFVSSPKTILFECSKFFCRRIGWLKSRAMPKWPKCMENKSMGTFLMLFLFKNSFVSSDVSKITNCQYQKLKSRGKTTWAVLFRNFTHKTIQFTWAHFMCIASTKKKTHISYHFGNGRCCSLLFFPPKQIEQKRQRMTTTHAIQIQKNKKNKRLWTKYDRFDTNSQKHTTPYWIIVIEFVSRCVLKCTLCEFVRSAAIVAERWSRLYTKSCPYIVAQWTHFNAQNMQCSRNLVGRALPPNEASTHCQYQITYMRPKARAYCKQNKKHEWTHQIECQTKKR